MSKETDEKEQSNGTNRRSFVKMAGMAGLGVAGAAFLLNSPASSAHRLGRTDKNTSPIVDTDVLQFALNLEYLEAEFYSVATTGETIEQRGTVITGQGQSGPTTGGSKVSLTGMTLKIAKELAADENQHVVDLRNIIQSQGVEPIAKPAINLDALSTGFANQSQFLFLARIFEDIGVTAYAAAAPLLTSATNLQYAAQILAVEALHSGNIRLQIAQNGIATAPPLDGVDVLPPPSGIRYFSTSVDALISLRSYGQVLYLAFGSMANVMAGGFFPSGVNGILNTSSGPA
jgi:hypothetical protein